MAVIPCGFLFLMASFLAWAEIHQSYKAYNAWWVLAALGVFWLGFTL